MRVFIALRLPKQLQESLSDLQNRMQIPSRAVKWVEKDNIHLTLRFLGEIEQDQLQPIKNILDNIARKYTGFNITMDNLGVFPGIKEPRILWVGIANGHNEIKSIVEDLNANLAELGFNSENNPFLPHITIARLRQEKINSSLTQELELLQKQLTLNKAEFYIDRIVLLQSTLTRQGPIYEDLNEINLRTA